MLNTEKIYVRTYALKDENFDVYEHVKTLIRNTELKLIEEKIADAKHQIEEAHADINALTCDETLVRQVLKENTDDFLKTRKELLALREECANCLPLDKVTSLSQTDRIHIILIAHTIYPKVVLDADFFDPEKENSVDFTKSINTYYKTGTINSELKSNMQACFSRLLGAEGEYFYGIKPKKSDFEKSDLIHFLSRFSARAKRTCTKDKQTKALTWGDYKYRTKTDKKKQQTAFTEFCAVIVDNASKHIVVKPELDKNETNSENTETK